MIVKDGAGYGYSASVNKNQRLRTKTISEEEQAFISRVDGAAYTWSNISTVYDAGDTILLIKNIDPNKNLHIVDIYGSSDTATEAVIHFPDLCISPTGSAVTGVNLNRGSGHVALATAIADETSNTQANIFWRGRIAANTLNALKPDGGTIILGYNNCIAIDLTTGGSACNVVVSAYYRE